MTLKELQQLEEILTWASGKVMSESMRVKVKESLMNVRQAIRAKLPMTDISGNMINGK